MAAAENEESRDARHRGRARLHAEQHVTHGAHVLGDEDGIANAIQELAAGEAKLHRSPPRRAKRGEANVRISVARAAALDIATREMQHPMS